MLVDHETAVNGLHVHGICELDDGTPLPVSTVRRMCCDAKIFPVVLDGDGEVLDVGRTRRRVNRAQRRTLKSMHRTCIHPDRTVQFSDCEIHHVLWWRLLRRTDIDNLVPLCTRHHHLVHDGRWTSPSTPDGSPPGPDPTKRSLRAARRSIEHRGERPPPPSVSPLQPAERKQAQTCAVDAPTILEDWDFDAYVTAHRRSDRRVSAW